MYSEGVFGAATTSSSDDPGGLISMSDVSMDNFEYFRVEVVLKQSPPMCPIWLSLSAFFLFPRGASLHLSAQRFRFDASFSGMCCCRV